jgi:hypothetical protein
MSREQEDTYLDTRLMPGRHVTVGGRASLRDSGNRSNPEHVSWRPVVFDISNPKLDCERPSHLTY